MLILSGSGPIGGRRSTTVAPATTHLKRSGERLLWIEAEPWSRRSTASPYHGDHLIRIVRTAA